MNSSAFTESSARAIDSEEAAELAKKQFKKTEEPFLPDFDPVKAEQEKEEKLNEQKKHNATFLIVLVDLIIPAMLILSAISCMSIVGMLFVILLYVHVIVCNRTSHSFTTMRTFLIVDFVINLIVFVFAIIGFAIDLDGEWVHILGLDFDNIIASDPTFTFVTSLIAMICQIISLIMLSRSDISDFTSKRRRLYTSFAVQYIFDFIWSVSNAFNAASNFCYLYFPILLFYIISNICSSCVGYNAIPEIITLIIMLYSLLFALFELYMVSYIGAKYNPGDPLAYIYIADDSTKAVNVVFAVLFAYISIENITTKRFKDEIARHKTSAIKLNEKVALIPYPMKILGEALLIGGVICAFVFAMFYPNYLSISWMIVSSIASFTDMNTLRRFLFPMLTVVFSLTFVAQVLTTFNFVDPPSDDGVEYRQEFLRLFGLYRYPGDFTFSACGFYLICLFGQIGKLVHAEVDNSRQMKKRHPPKLEQNYRDEDEEEKSQFSAGYEDDAYQQELREKNQKMKRKELKKNQKKEKKKEQHQKAQAALAKFLHFCSLVWKFFYALFSYLALAALVVLCITIGYYKNRFAFKIICVIFIIIVCVALYFRPVFEFVKFLFACISVVAAFYKTCLTPECATQLDRCLFYGKFGDSIQDMVDTGLMPPPEMSLAQFLWPIAVAFVLATFLTKNNKALHMKLPPFIAAAIFVIVAILHLLYMFLYETNIFSLLFLIVGIIMFTCQYLKNFTGLCFACCLSCIVVSFQLVVFQLSHFDNARNLITSIIKSSIVDISHIYEPSVEIALLAAILFLSTIAFNTKPAKQMHWFVQGILIEARARFSDLYFFLCWIFIFLFSISNHKATCIKFLLMLFFSFGRCSLPVFEKIRVGFLIFNVLYLCVQFVFHIFALYGSGYCDYLDYIGLYFNKPEMPTKSQRNLPVLWQLLTAICGIININIFKGQTTDPRYEAFWTTKIYNAFCAMLHHWLPLIIQISLCISTLYNPSVFGWFSFIVMLLVNYKPSSLQKGAIAITIIFNICFIIQYLMFLGLPKMIKGNTSLIVYLQEHKHYSQETLDFIKSWFRWTGTYDVRMSALTTNCVSSFIFTLYIKFKDVFVDYNAGYNGLPWFMKEIIRFYTIYVYEIMFTLILIVASCVKSIDGVLFFILAACLFVVTLLAGYSKKRSLDILSVATFGVIALRLISRIPVFTEDGIGHWMRTAFDLPFQNDSKYENLWIIIYALERLAIHVMNANIFFECSRYQYKRLAFRYIRSRQIAILEQIDQDILEQKHELEISQIKSMTTAHFEQVMDSMRQNDNLIIGRAEMLSTTTTFSDFDHKKKHWYHIFTRFYKSCAKRLIQLISGSMHLNSEAGMNYLTLESLTLQMKKALRCFENGSDYLPEEREKQFYESLPPSIPLHFQSVADFIGYQYIPPSKVEGYLVRYILAFIRRIALPLLTLMVLIYVYIKPYFFSMAVVLMYCCLILPIDIKGYPIIYIIFFSFVLFVYALRNICTIDILKDHINDASNSVTIQQMSISVIKMFGIDPEETSIVEIFLFLFTVFFIVDQLAWCEVYPPKYYYDKFEPSLEGFPDEYCYQCNKAADKLGMIVEKPVPFIQQFKSSMTKAGLVDTPHSTVMMVIDVISFILILILWGTWTHSDSNGSIGGDSGYVFKIDVAFIFILLIQTCFSLLCYAFSLSSNHIGLYFVNLIWFLYTYCMSFYYIQSQQREVPASLQFFFFVRFCWHLVAAHKCFRGRRIVAFKYPSFVKDYKYIFYMNKFIRICPFVFEIQTILIWMSQKTKLYLLDFMVIRDVSMQLEDLICQQTDPNYYDYDEPDSKKKTQNICLKGGILLLLLAIILFVPMFFMATGTPNTGQNPPISVQLEIGLPSFPPFLTSQGSISPISSGIQQEIANSNEKSLHFLVLADRESISLIDFPSYSFDTWNPSSDLSNMMLSTLRSGDSIAPYFKFSLFFNRPTSVSSVQNVVYMGQLSPITEAQKYDINQILTGNASARFGPLILPTTIIVSADENVYSINGLTRPVELELSQGADVQIWDLLLGEEQDTSLSFLKTDESYRVLLYSQEVAKDSSSGLISTDPSIIGIYLLLIITIGMVLRAFSLNLINTLWIDRMERPQKLYRMVVAMNAFRAARDTEKEKLMANQLLNTLRSQESCLRITANNYIG